MSATIKVIGGGPLVGKTFYGVKEAFLDGKKGGRDIAIRLNVDPFDRGDPCLQTFVFNAVTGFCKEGAGESDLLRAGSHRNCLNLVLTRSHFVGLVS